MRTSSLLSELLGQACWGYVLGIHPFFLYVSLPWLSSKCVLVKGAFSFFSRYFACLSAGSSLLVSFFFVFLDLLLLLLLLFVCFVLFVDHYRLALLLYCSVVRVVPKEKQE